MATAHLTEIAPGIHECRIFDDHNAVPFEDAYDQSCLLIVAGNRVEVRLLDKPLPLSRRWAIREAGYRLGCEIVWYRRIWREGAEVRERVVEVRARMRQ